MSTENTKNRFRERFVTCGEETLEEMENYVDKVNDLINSSNQRSPDKVIECSGKRQKRPSVKTSGK